MGFDPRQWSGGVRPDQRVTSNVEALLAENDSLRREILRLNRELESLQRVQPNWREPSATARAPLKVRPEQIHDWGRALAAQPGWTTLRQQTLEKMADQLNRSAFPAHLTLEQRLDRLVPDLGRDLMAAVGTKPSKKSAAVLAAFALYGVRASEWLDEDPRRVVSDLRQRLMQTTGSSSQRRTRSDRRRTDRGSEPRVDSRSSAFAVLGLAQGAPPEAIKQAFRRLVKRHHPDVGGSVEAFRRVNEAYQQLMG